MKIERHPSLHTEYAVQLYQHKFLNLSPSVESDNTSATVHDSLPYLSMSPADRLTDLTVTKAPTLPKFVMQLPIA